MSSTSTSTPAAPIPSIGRDELIGALQSGRIVLVDVLSPESFAAMHIPGAISLPVADIPTRARDLVPDRNAPIVAYCGGPT